jgi:hypothetical protein
MTAAESCSLALLAYGAGIGSYIVAVAVQAKRDKARRRPQKPEGI